MSNSPMALPDRCILSVTGADATRFLNSQLTVAISDDNRIPRLAAWCDAKGRALCLFRVFPAESGWFLSLPAELSQSLVKRLKMFILRSDVLIQDVTHEYLHVANQPGQLAIGACGWHEALLETAINPGQLTYSALIDAAVPEVLSSTSGRWVPQWMGLDKLDAIDFDKGCYPGQEVIAKLRYRGEVKRGLRKIAVDGDCPEPGAIIRDGNDKPQGEVIMADASDNGGCTALAVMRHSDSTPSLALDTGSAVTVL